MMVLKNIFIFFAILLITLNAQLLNLNRLIKGGKSFKLSAIKEARRLFNNEQHPDVGLSVPELIVKYGYPVEIHNVITPDNYILSLHRIPHGKKNKHETNKKVIFLLHGLLCSSADWVLLGPEKSLAYLLADMGYDVWMGNTRGNRYSRSHAFLDPDRNANEFWDFSWHAMGIYDVPTMIDYILYETEKDKLFYVGHSQGCTTFFVMTSLLPEYNDKIEMMFALAPAVFMANAESPILRYAANYFRSTKLLSNIIGPNEFLPHTKFIRDIAGILCDEHSVSQRICANALFLLTGYDEEQLDKEKLPVMLSNTPAGSSTKQVLHFIQNARDSRNYFRQFDYGLITNKLIYSTFTPPEYPLDQVTARIALFSSYNDIMVAVKDVAKLHSMLPNANVVLHYVVPFKQFTHMDFQWAKDVVPLVYNKIFELLNDFERDQTIYKNASFVCK